MTYAAYGNSIYRYGDASRLYGTGTFANMSWAVEIDWDNDGAYSGENEAQYAIGLQTSRGRNQFLNIDADGNANGFEPVRVGAATLTLDNTSRRYDPYNTSSDLYPNVQAGRTIKIRVGYGSEIYSVIHGIIRSITPEDNETEQKVVLEIEDGLRLLQNTDASVAIQTNIGVGAAISAVLTDVNYPSLFGTNIEESADTLTYWWAVNRAAGELRDLAQAELGQFFIAANGAATFYSRHHIGNTPPTLTSADFLKAIDVHLPLEVIRNIVKLSARPRTLQASADLWTLQDVPLIPAGSSFTVWGSYTYNGAATPAINLIAPVATTDYTANTASDGSGTNLTASFSVAFTDFGTSGKFIITNNSASDGYLTLLKVRGQAITSLSPSLLIEEDTASQAIYGKALLTIDSNWLQNTNLADDFANWLISYLPSPQKMLTVRMETRPDLQFSLDLFDIANVTIERLSIDGVIYRVMNIEHQWMLENGQGVITTWILQPNSDLSTYWQFTATMGVTTRFGI